VKDEIDEGILRCVDGEERNEWTRRVVCVECGIGSGVLWRHWQAHRTDELFGGEEPRVAFYCPVCAFAEFGPRRRSDQEQAG
jgi:hypothetical protein